jgi:sialate O-acetylesterase
MLPFARRLMLRTSLLSLLLATVGECAGAQLASIFTDHAVLQRERPVPIWGQSKPGEKVEVTFGSHSVTATANESGRWSATLPAMPASSEPRDLTASSPGRSVTKADVVVGDVWLAAGQSNMERSVQRIETPAEEIARATAPLIRHFNVRQVVAERPTDELGGEWVVCDPKTVGTFSAVGYFFAKEMTEALGVPVGIINASYGGTRIEAWCDPDLLASHDGFAGVRERWIKAAADYAGKAGAYGAALAKWQREAELAKARGIRFTVRQPGQPEGAPGHRQTPSGLYNGMIHPLVPYSLRGFLWYQGESNVDRPEEYAELFPALINSWRGKFGQGDLPFYFVQLANFKGLKPGQDWALFREVQSRALALPETGMAVTVDIGDPEDIHPKNKKDVGRRLSLIARKRLFGQAVTDQGPTLQEAKKEGQSIRLSFANADGLRSTGESVAGFELAGEDGIYHGAQAVLEDHAVVVSSDLVENPLVVRYGWHNTPTIALFNESGLPMTPFQHALP